MTYSVQKDGYEFFVSLQEDGKIYLASYGIAEDYYGWTESILEVEHVFDPQDNVAAYFRSGWNYFPFEHKTMKEFYDYCREEASAKKACIQSTSSQCN